MASIQRPEYLSNGEMALIDSDLVDKLKFGDPISGWSGDEGMALWYNATDDCIYLSSLDDNGEEYVVMRSRPGMRVMDMQILNMLAERDRNRGYDVAAELKKHNDALEDKLHHENDDKWDSAAEKLAWALRKDAT